MVKKMIQYSVGIILILSVLFAFAISCNKVIILPFEEPKESTTGGKTNDNGGTPFVDTTSRDTIFIGDQKIR